jgi:hypothetical protein
MQYRELLICGTKINLLKSKKQILIHFFIKYLAQSFISFYKFYNCSQNHIEITPGHTQTPQSRYQFISACQDLIFKKFRPIHFLSIFTCTLITS